MLNHLCLHPALLQVRFVLKDDIARQLDLGNIVLLSNLGFTASGEVLNCNMYDVGLHAAVEVCLGGWLGFARTCMWLLKCGG